tara:strand:- start:2084 stop:2467 length:384 start_codon:yes stop_codon:yes gene_type:complete
MGKVKLGKALAKKLDDFLKEMEVQYKLKPEDTKAAIRNYANEGYAPGDPKRMLAGDDEPLALMITTNTILPNRAKQFMQDIFEQSVMDTVKKDVRNEILGVRLKALDPKKMTKMADGGMVVKGLYDG